jgi:hypothetical protein
MGRRRDLTAVASDQDAGQRCQQEWAHFSAPLWFFPHCGYRGCAGNPDTIPITIRVRFRTSIQTETRPLPYDFDGRRPYAVSRPERHARALPMVFQFTSGEELLACLINAAALHEQPNKGE